MSVAVATDSRYSMPKDNMPTTSFLPTATLRSRSARSSKLRNAIAHGATIELRDANGAKIVAPELTELLQLALRGLASGHDIMLLTGETELSPTEAGQVLGCSRQYVDRLIDLGEIPAHNLPESSHRRIRASDLATFQTRRNNRTRKIADAVTALTDAGARY
jgi:excisionase family DNA binding protein